MPAAMAVPRLLSVDNSWPVRAFGSWPGALRAVAIVVLVAVVVGGVTSPAQQYLPDALRSLANAAGPWFVVIFVAVRLGRSPTVLAILLGIAGFVLLNVSYGVVSTLRGFPYSGANIWTIVAIPAGVVVGFAATWLGSKRRLLVSLGAATPVVVLLVDGVYGLTVVLSTTGPVVWILELVGAAVWMAWVWARRLRPGARS
jgi:hypothetical protein